jgi:integrase
MVEEAPAFKPAFTIPAQNGLRCPECGSERLYKDGIRYLTDGSTVQRFLCRDCGYRFSWPRIQRQHRGQILKSQQAITYGECSSRALALLEQSVEGAMNNVEESEKRAAGATTSNQTSQADIKGRLVEFLWWLKKQGFSEKTIHGYVEMLKLLAASGANIFEPESVKEALARLEKGSSWRHAAVCAYSKFAEMHKLQWEKPKVKRVRPLPFIPLERELDDLIAATNRKTACFLQLLKETGMRAGEALQLKWVDVDFERRTITLNTPEKGGNPRAFKVSPKLIEMLNSLPRKTEKIFPVSYTALKCNFLRARKKLAYKLQNPRLLQISFHTFRHWKATMEYHKTKDPLYVKELLGHKKLDTTLLYIQIEKTLFQNSSTDEFTVKIAKTPEEIQSLLAVGFEWVGVKDGLVYLRKRV